MSSKIKHHPILIVGIDGGTWDILEPAIKGGYMPTLRKLRDEGAWGKLQSTIPAITPAAWSTFQTGCNPGYHGILDFSWWDRNTKQLNFVNSRHLRRTIWSRLSQRGYRVGVINVPMTYPPQPVNGYVVTGILTPSLESEFTYPPELKRELLSAIPDYHIFNLENAGNLDPSPNFRSILIDRLVQIAGLRLKAAEFLLHKEPLDVLMVHFQASDVIQHALWDYLDPAHPRFTSEKQKDLFNRFYRSLDGYIGELIDLFRKRCGDNSLTVLLSDHGFQGHRCRFQLGNWLYRQGYLKLLTRDISARRLKQWTRRLRIGRLLRPFVSEKKMQTLEKKLVASVPGIAWEKSRAFATGNCGEGYIYLLEEGTARETSAAALIEMLTAIRNPATGEKVIENVWRKEDLYSGPSMEKVPDLVVVPAAGYSCTGPCRPERGLFTPVMEGRDFHLGKHHPDGIYIIHGSGVRPTEARARLIDLSATLLAFAGAPTDGMEGIPLRDCFVDSGKSWEKTPADTCLQDAWAVSEEVYTSDDEEQIKKRLEDLGYL